jgi:hypothetical protein
MEIPNIFQAQSSRDFSPDLLEPRATVMKELPRDPKLKDRTEPSATFGAAVLVLAAFMATQSLATATLSLQTINMHP